eukprot:gene8263-29124_t
MEAYQSYHSWFHSLSLQEKRLFAVAPGRASRPLLQSPCAVPLGGAGVAA